MTHYSKYDRTIAPFHTNYLKTISDTIQWKILTMHRKSPLLHEMECVEAFNLELDIHYFLETLDGIPHSKNPLLHEI